MPFEKIIKRINEWQLVSLFFTTCNFFYYDRKEYNLKYKILEGCNLNLLESCTNIPSNASDNYADQFAMFFTFPFTKDDEFGVLSKLPATFKVPIRINKFTENGYYIEMEFLKIKQDDNLFYSQNEV